MCVITPKDFWIVVMDKLASDNFTLIYEQSECQLTAK